VSYSKYTSSTGKDNLVHNLALVNGGVGCDKVDRKLSRSRSRRRLSHCASRRAIGSSLQSRKQNSAHHLRLKMLAEKAAAPGGSLEGTLLAVFGLNFARKQACLISAS
jgi:hypothetical protein